MKNVPVNDKGEIILGDVFDAKIWAEEFMRIKAEKNFEIDEGLMLAWFANAIMAGYDYAHRSKKPNASEAIYGFCAWITCRKEVVPAGSSENAAPWAELAKQYCEQNEFPPISDNYPNNLAIMKS